MNESNISRPFSDQFAAVPRHIAPMYFSAIEKFYKCSPFDHREKPLPDDDADNKGGGKVKRRKLRRHRWFDPSLGAADMLLAKHVFEEMIRRKTEQCFRNCDENIRTQKDPRSTATTRASCGGS